MGSGGRACWPGVGTPRSWAVSPVQQPWKGVGQRGIVGVSVVIGVTEAVDRRIGRGGGTTTVASESPRWRLLPVTWRPMGRWPSTACLGTRPWASTVPGSCFQWENPSGVMSSRGIRRREEEAQVGGQ